MMDLVGKFTNPGELVVDFFEGAWAVLNAFLLLPKHSHFVEFDKYNAYFEDYEESNVEMYTRQLLVFEFSTMFATSNIKFCDKFFMCYSSNYFLK